MNNITPKTFSEIDLSDEFFDSLRTDYLNFDNWFKKKKNEYAFVQYEHNKIIGFLYLKIEQNIVTDVIPNIQANKILKIGTFKINAHGTKMGEQFIKVITDYAINKNIDVCYVTIYKKHTSLINLVQQFGFELYGEKGTGIYKENVYLKNMRKLTGDINKDFPLINITSNKKYLLSIYPKYHSILFPNSILNTESKDIIKDISYTNSIHKIYICTMPQVSDLQYGDIVVVYRTSEHEKPAEYCAVATSVCVVENVKHQNEFNNFNEFYNYACRYSVFNKNDLQHWYNKGNCKAIKMTYNIALNKRLVRHDLIEEIGLRRNQYWGFFELTDNQFIDILKYGQINTQIVNRTNV